MPSPRKKLFEELGLLAEESQANPYLTLGIDPQFARMLLNEDSSGAAVQLVARGIYRVLAQRYHPDIAGTGNQARFEEIHGAHTRIGAALPASLLRWTKVETSAATAEHLAKQQAQQAAIAHRAAGLVQQNMELGHHPQHFSQLVWSQGVLLRRGGTSLLARPYQNGGLQVLRGQAAAMGVKGHPLDVDRPALGFHAFMRAHRAFGLEPDTKIVAYLNEAGRASILTADLGFIMDITDPVTAYKRRRRGSEVDAWSRSVDPLLLVTQVGGEDYTDTPEAQIISFPGQTFPEKNNRNAPWSVPMEVAGTVADADFFRRIRHNKAAGAVAIEGSGGRQVTNYFSMVAVPTERIIELDVGYSPLIAPGSSLLLHDSQSRMPVVTNTQVVGMLGSGSQY